MSEFTPETYADARKKNDVVALIAKKLIEEYGLDTETSLSAIYESGLTDAIETDTPAYVETHVDDYINTYCLKCF